MHRLVTFCSGVFATLLGCFLAFIGLEAATEPSYRNYHGIAYYSPPQHTTFTLIVIFLSAFVLVIVGFLVFARLFAFQEPDASDEDR